MIQQFMNESQQVAATHFEQLVIEEISLYEDSEVYLKKLPVFDPNKKRFKKEEKLMIETIKNP